MLYECSTCELLAGAAPIQIKMDDRIGDVICKNSSSKIDFKTNEIMPGIYSVIH